MLLITASRHLIMTLSVTIFLMSQSMELIQPRQDLCLDQPIKIIGTDGTVSFDRNIVYLSANIADKIKQLEKNSSWNGEIVLPTISVSELNIIKQVLELFYNEAPSVYYAADTIIDNEKMLRALKKDIQDNKDFIVIRWLERLKPFVTTQNKQQRNKLLHALNSFGLPLVEATAQAIREEAVHGIPFFMKVVNDRRKQIMRNLLNDPQLIDFNKIIQQAQSATLLINKTSNTDPVILAEWPPDEISGRIITVSRDNVAQVWVCYDNNYWAIATFPAGQSAAWSFDGKHIITSDNNTGTIWGHLNCEYFHLVGTYTMTGFNKSLIQSGAWLFDENHKTITLTHDCSAKKWNIELLIKVGSYLRDHLTYSELMLLKNRTAAKNNGTQYQLNHTTQKVFDSLGGDDLQIKNALHQAITPYVTSYKEQ